MFITARRQKKSRSKVKEKSAEKASVFRKQYHENINRYLVSNLSCNCMTATKSYFKKIYTLAEANAIKSELQADIKTHILHL